MVGVGGHISGEQGFFMEVAGFGVGGVIHFLPASVSGFIQLVFVPELQDNFITISTMLFFFIVVPAVFLVIKIFQKLNPPGK